MKKEDLKDKSVEDLEEHLQGLYKDQFNYRMQNSAGQLGQIHLVKAVRKDIARVKTIITEKQTSEARKVKSEA
jgi:large subunit ribosomal protein L29|tara:strand:- start:417 stop:635 length:219 start_codon:yes stop_codon:yes gene_type:complete